MPSFKDRINNYNANKSATVPVNPPEATKVLETQSAPEAAGQPEPAPAPTAEPVKRTRRTKAEMEAARAAEQSGESVTESAAPAVSQPAVATTGNLAYAIAVVKALLPPGVSVTIQA